jgi:class 3 adenylate cyclase
VVREQLAAYGGREVKTMGDGFLATFDGPAKAIRCACTIAERSSSEGIEIRAAWGSALLDAVRIWCHHW